MMRVKSTKPAYTFRAITPVLPARRLGNKFIMAVLSVGF